MVRKRDTEDEIAVAVVDASGELSIARRGDLGSDDMEMKAAAKIDALKEKPKAVVEKLEATKEQEATKGCHISEDPNGVGGIKNCHGGFKNFTLSIGCDQVYIVSVGSRRPHPARRAPPASISLWRPQN